MKSNQRLDAPKGRVLVAGVTGNILEWYDFALYGYLAPIIAPHFFPSNDPLSSLIDSYAVFALGFLARPLGGMLFGQIGDRWGRRQMLTLSVVSMALPTFLMGLLPTYETIGIFAPILLVVLRLMQGVSAGGEFSGSIIFLVEQAPPGQRGVYGSAANSAAMLGGMLGAGGGWLVTQMLSPEAMQDWGWRIPFLTGLLVALFGLWMRRSVPDTNAFTELAKAAALERAPLRASLRGQWREMALGAGLNWVASAGYYLVFVWFVGNMTDIVKLPYDIALAIGTIGLVVGLFATLAAGVLSDRFGAPVVLRLGSLATAFCAIPLLMLAGTGITGALMSQVGLAVLIAIFLGVLPAVFVSLHTVTTRCTALSVGYNVALALFGGTAPLLATLLVWATGWASAPSLYLVLTALVCAALVRFIPAE